MQIDFILSEKERINVIQFALKNGCKIIPACHYSSEKYRIITDFDQYLQYSAEEPLLFMVNDKYSFYPLELDFFQRDGKKIWYINQRQGGPTIDFYSPIIGEKTEKIIGPGFIGIYEYYYHGNNKITPNSELKNLFKAFKSYIESITKPIVLSKRTYWLGKYTAGQALNGNLKLLPISGIELIELI